MAQFKFYQHQRGSFKIEVDFDDEAFNKWHQQTFASYTQARPRTEQKKESVKLTKIQIEHELDIIRGVIPTPKGYKIDKARAKELMKMLQSFK